MIRNIKRLTTIAYVVHSLIAIFTIGLAIVFYRNDIPVLFYAAVIALCYYAFAYILITKGFFSIYIKLIYLVITLYMCTATICLGVDSGFQMYSLALIPLTFCFDYIAEKNNLKRVNAKLFSALIGIAYFLSTGYTVLKHPLYHLDSEIEVHLLALNSTWVFFLLVFYSSLIINNIRTSEGKLIKLARRDELTELYNRHFMIEKIGELLTEGLSGHWIAMIDVDDFQKINDTYGHNVGDLVLVSIADALRSACKGCIYSRWGGEEFLILGPTSLNKETILGNLRESISRQPVIVNNSSIHVSVTVGACDYITSQTVDEWIQNADRLLYLGKKSGKNCVMV